jgi:hypothetical protein
VACPASSMKKCVKKPSKIDIYLYQLLPLNNKLKIIDGYKTI